MFFSLLITFENTKIFLSNLVSMTTKTLQIALP